MNFYQFDSEFDKFVSCFAVSHYIVTLFMAVFFKVNNVFFLGGVQF
jgi:hypothetical protein